MGAAVGLCGRFGQLLLHMSIWRRKPNPPNQASDQLRWSDSERVTLAEIRKACGKQASAGNRLCGPTRHDPGLAPEAERIKVGCAGIGNSKPLGMVAPPRLWWLEIVAEMITFGLRNIREQTLSWKAGALLGERMPNGPASKCVASRGASS